MVIINPKPIMIYSFLNKNTALTTLIENCGQKLKASVSH